MKMTWRSQKKGAECPYAERQPVADHMRHWKWALDDGLEALAKIDARFKTEMHGQAWQLAL
jgi:hypothetical protein